MPLSPQLSPDRLLILLGLSFFFGLAFEEFYGEQRVKPPGGVRTFPLLAFAGSGLYLLEPVHALAFTAGLLVLGAWLGLFYRLEVQARDSGSRSSTGLIVPLANLLAYLLGPIALAAPIWVGVAFAVAAVLLLGAREPLHALARRIPQDELATLGKFLILTGIVLPLLPKEPVTKLTAITPLQVWLAVVAVSGLSYASYLVQRYVAKRGGALAASLLGGMYSSTVTTVVLARRLRDESLSAPTLQAGILLATAVMYLRLLAIVGIFNLALALALLPAMAPLGAIALALAGLRYWRGDGRGRSDGSPPPRNPLELSAAFVFALLFVVTSLASNWAQGAFGASGLDWLAAIVGVTDIDPFVLSVAQGAAGNASLHGVAAAILIAASSNNLLKAAYAVGFGGRRAGLSAVGGLGLLALLGFAAAAWRGGLFG